MNIFTRLLLELQEMALLVALAVAAPQIAGAAVQIVCSHDPREFESLAHRLGLFPAEMLMPDPAG